jgi:hypothetical protein
VASTTTFPPPLGGTLGALYKPVESTEPMVAAVLFVPDPLTDQMTVPSACSRNEPPASTVAWDGVTVMGAVLKPSPPQALNRDKVTDRAASAAARRMKTNFG